MLQYFLPLEMPCAHLHERDGEDQWDREAENTIDNNNNKMNNTVTWTQRWTREWQRKGERERKRWWESGGVSVVCVPCYKQKDVLLNKTKHKKRGKNTRKWNISLSMLVEMWMWARWMLFLLSSSPIFVHIKPLFHCFELATTTIATITARSNHNNNKLQPTNYSIRMNSFACVSVWVWIQYARWRRSQIRHNIE